MTSWCSGAGRELAHGSGGREKEDLPSCKITADLMKGGKVHRAGLLRKASIIYHDVHAETSVFTNIKLVVLTSSSHLKVKTALLF